MSNEKIMVLEFFKDHFAKYCIMVAEDLEARLKADKASFKIHNALQHTEVALCKYLENSHIKKEDKISKEHFYTICSLFELYSGYLNLVEGTSHNFLLEETTGRLGNKYDLFELRHREYLCKLKDDYLYSIADIY